MSESNAADFETRIANLEAELAECRSENERLNRELADERARTTNLEDQVEALRSATTETAESDESATDNGSLTPMAQLIQAGEDSVIGHVTASVRRAKAMAEHFGKWASKTPNGLVVSENLKTLLETATGEDLVWKQVYRAGRALAKFSKGAIGLKNS